MSDLYFKAMFSQNKLVLRARRNKACGNYTDFNSPDGPA